MGKIWKKRKPRSGLSLIDIMVAFGVTAVLGSVAVWGLAAFLPKSKAIAPKVKIPVDSYASPAVTLDLTLPLIIVGGTIASFVLIKFGFPIWNRFITSRRELKNFALNNATAWSLLRKRKESLMVEWSKYETDVALMIDFPIMTDYSDPIVHKVIAAMQKLNSTEMLLGDTKTIDAHGSKLEHAVNDFELAFRTAEKHARRQGQNHLSAQEQRKLATARVALDIIMGDTSTGFEIEAAYKTLRSSLKGIIDVPQQAMASIESLTRRAVAA